MVNQFPIFMNQLLCSLAGGLIRMSQNLLGTNLLYQKDNKTGEKNPRSKFLYLIYVINLADTYGLGTICICTCFAHY